MPMDRSLYPDNWDKIALAVKTAANWTCQECDRPCRRPGESDGDLLERIQTQHPNWVKDLTQTETLDGLWLIGTKSLTRFLLTAAHVNHDPENPNAELKAWCTVCHCRYDLKGMATKKRLKRERLGQLNLLENCHAES